MTLRFFYKNSNPSSQGYLFISAAPDYELFLINKYETLPSLSQSEIENFLSRYNAVIQEFLALNKGNKFFKMTPFALRNTWQSSFYQGAESAARLEKLTNGIVYFYSPEWFLWAAKRLKAGVDENDMRRARSDLRLFTLRRFYMAWQGLRFCWSRRVQKKYPLIKSDIFLASVWTEKALEQWARQGREPFYGDLPAQLITKNYKAAIIYHAEGLIKTDDVAGPVPAFNLMVFLGWKEWLCLIWTLFTLSFKKPHNSEFPVLAVERDLATSLSNQVPLSLISYKAARRLMILNPGARFITLYENNCWEQGIHQAAKELGRNIYGFQHTAFARSALKMDNHIENKMFPDKVFTSGAESARILVKVMGHNPRKVDIGCSLRYQPVESAPSSGKKILILMQGAPDDALFLHTVRRYLKPEEVVVRAHPSWPFKGTLPFNVSTNDLATDLAQARLALYTGTTASFEALSAFVPVIHVDLGQALSADPLFTLENCSIKKTWKTGEILDSLITEIDMLSPADRQSGFETAQSYIKNYFMPANEDTVNAMIGKLLDDR